MKERPILFSAPMVRAILDGRKSQTRRVIDGQPLWVHRGVTPIPPYGPFTLSNGALCAKILSAGDGVNGDSTTTMGVLTDRGRMVRCPYGVPGDRLWLRETFLHTRAEYEYSISTSVPYLKAQTVYAADVPGGVKGAGFTPGIFMPRNLSRITLEITDVRVQRVQEISEEDARAEGATAVSVPVELGDRERATDHVRLLDYRAGFQSLWDSINGKTHPWANNEWVWAVSFRRAA